MLIYISRRLAIQCLVFVTQFTLMNLQDGGQLIKMIDEKEVLMKVGVLRSTEGH